MSLKANSNNNNISDPPKNSTSYYNSFIPDNSLFYDIKEDKFKSNDFLDSNDAEDSFIPLSHLFPLEFSDITKISEENIIDSKEKVIKDYKSDDKKSLNKTNFFNIKKYDSEIVGKSLLSLMKVKGDNEYKCPFCNVEYIQIKAVYRHIKNTHTQPEGEPYQYCGIKIKHFYDHKK